MPDDLIDIIPLHEERQYEEDQEREDEQYTGADILNYIAREEEVPQEVVDSLRKGQEGVDNNYLSDILENNDNIKHYKFTKDDDSNRTPDDGTPTESAQGILDRINIEDDILRPDGQEIYVDPQYTGPGADWGPDTTPQEGERFYGIPRKY